MNTYEKHILNIKQIYPQSIEISQPAVRGFAHDLYIVKTAQNDKIVCRFASKTTAEHDLYVSKLLNSNGITVPDISLCNFGEEYCETYPLIAGKTLYERIHSGISHEKLDNVYNQLFQISYKMAQIPYEFSEKVSVPLTAKTAIIFCKLLNSGTVGLGHTDLIAKNILLDDSDNICALLDLDSVYPESMSFVIINMLREARHYGYDIRKLIPLCDKNHIKPRLLGIAPQAKIYSAAKSLGEMIFGEFMIKQILKLKVK